MSVIPPKYPNGHPPRWWRKHPEALAKVLAEFESTHIKTATLQETSDPKRHWLRRIAGPLLVFITNVVLTVLDAKGYLKGIPDGVLGVTWFASFVCWAWAEGHLKTIYLKHKQISLVGLLLASVVVASLVQYRSHLFAFIYRSKDAPFVRPTNKAVKFEGNVNPTYRRCYGLSDEKEIECLCPRSLDYELVALPTPQDDNYATLVKIAKSREAMYRIQLFFRTAVAVGKIDGSPFGGKNAMGLASVEWTDDKYTTMLTSSAPEDLFTIEIKSSEGLRLKCVNQIN